MKFYTFDEIMQILSLINYNSTDTLMIHSSLVNIGFLKDVNPKENVRLLLDFLIKTTQNGALLMPNYNYSFPNTKKSNLITQKSEVGVLSETFNQKTKICSSNPMFSINGVGKKAKELLQPQICEYNPFLENSTFHRIYETNGIFLFLGIDIRVCTFMVYIEAMNAVKYRFFKPFFGSLETKTNEEFMGNFYHFCLPANRELSINFNIVQEKMLQQNIIKSLKIGYNNSYIVRAKPLFDFVSNELLKNPYILLKNPPKRFWIYENNEEKIIKELK